MAVWGPIRRLYWDEGLVALGGMANFSGLPMVAELCRDGRWRHGAAASAAHGRAAGGRLSARADQSRHVCGEGSLICRRSHYLIISFRP